MAMKDILFPSYYKIHKKQRFNVKVAVVFSTFRQNCRQGDNAWYRFETNITI